MSTSDCAPPRGLPRLIEVPLAALLLTCTLPIVAAAGLAIRISSPGPAIFRQRRIGRGGRPFELLKLRSMSRRRSGGPLTAARDPRVTRVGRLLRATKLDELPQLWNVIRGDMSLVGPRPEVPAFVDLDSNLWRRVLSVRPGITDPVSIRLRNEAAWLESLGGDPIATYRERLLPWKLAGYVEYIDGRSAWRDLGVLWQTLLAVLFAAGEEPNLSDLPPRPGSSATRPHVDS